MTTNGRKCLRVLRDLEEGDPESVKLGGFTATEITEKFTGLPKRRSPVMTVSSYLTHLQREGYVSRLISADKTTAWWKRTAKGRRIKVDDAKESQAASSPS